MTTDQLIEQAQTCGVLTIEEAAIQAGLAADGIGGARGAKGAALLRLVHAIADQLVASGMLERFLVFGLEEIRRAKAESVNVGGGGVNP